MSETLIPSSTAAIILAAGSSSRMGSGRHKLLLPLGNRPVLAHVIEAALSSRAKPILVIVGHQAESVRAAIASYSDSPAIHIIENPEYMEGMSTSLRAGIQALMQLDTDPPLSPDSALILLGDQPMMTPAIIDQLITAREATRKSIITPLYSGKRGQPVLFAANLFPELIEVAGDEGARRVIARHPQEVAGVELGDELPTFDVDTWEAYQEVLTVWQRIQVDVSDDR